MDVAAVEPRQAEVEHDERGECLFDLPERVRSVFDRDHGVAGCAQCHPVHIAQLRIVLDDKDLPQRRRGHRTSLREDFLP
jgi:hypothetical protein